MAKKKVKKQRLVVTGIAVLVLLFILYFLVSPSKKITKEETTTTTIATTTLETTTPTTTVETTVETTLPVEIVRSDCDMLRFKIISSTFKNDVLSFNLKNIGSVNIDEFVVSMMYPDKTMDEKFEDMYVEPNEVEVHSVTVESDFKNASIYVLGCPLLYRCQATTNFCVFKEIF